MEGLPPRPAGAVRLTEPHGPDCFGCGPESSSGLLMEVFRFDDEVTGDVTFDGRHTAAHGAVHGGAVATVCDDLLSFLVHVHAEPAVTSSLQVTYRKPVLGGEPYRLTGRVTRREGRKLTMECEGTAADGTVRFTAEALFIRVDLTYFDRPGASLPPGFGQKKIEQRASSDSPRS